MTPQVRLVAKTVGMPEGIQLKNWIEADEFVAYAARVSNPANQMNTETAPKLLESLQRRKHWSPFEMADAVLEITTTRDIAHQILRHRSFSFQEFSQRYAEATQFHTDFPARRQDTKNRQNSIDDMSPDVLAWFEIQQEQVADECVGRYKEALGRGIAKEVARKLLPEGLTQTTLYMKGSMRSWIHYLEQRLDPSTQKEHRDVAIECQRILADHFPTIFQVAKYPPLDTAPANEL